MLFANATGTLLFLFLTVLFFTVVPLFFTTFFRILSVSARRLRAHQAVILYASRGLHSRHYFGQNGPALRRTRGSGVSRPADPREGIFVALAAAPLFAPRFPAERDRRDARATVHADRRAPPARRRTRRRGGDVRSRVQGARRAVCKSSSGCRRLPPS